MIRYVTKNKLIKYFFIALFHLTNFACEYKSPQPVDPIDLLPPITQTGENTFGCLVDGEASFNVSPLNFTARYSGKNLFITFDNYRPLGQTIALISNTDFIHSVPATYAINDSTPVFAEYTKIKPRPVCLYATDSTIGGALTIHYLDTINSIISGTFEFKALSTNDSQEGCPDTVNITDGRFDLQYK